MNTLTKAVIYLLKERLYPSELQWPETDNIAEMIRKLEDSKSFKETWEEVRMK